MPQNPSSEFNNLHAQKLRGVNLSGWLVMIPWITPSLFAGTEASDQTQLATMLGSKDFLALQNKHRKTFIEPEDFVQIAKRGYNAVRIPVSWRVFQEEAYADENEATALACLDRAFAWANKTDLDVVLDVVVDVEAEDFADSTGNFLTSGNRLREPLIDVCSELAKRYMEESHFYGIEPLSGVQGQRRRGLSVSKGVPLHTLRIFYRDCYEAMREAVGERPALILSAADHAAQWSNFMVSKHYKNVILDLSIFQQRSGINAYDAHGISSIMSRTYEIIKRAQKSKLPIIIGEWSCGLPPSSTTSTPEGRIALERMYGATQIITYTKLKGWFFQTWKTEKMLQAWDARVALSSFERGMFD